MENETALIEVLETGFLSTAEWRRQKAEEFPDDSRNLEAAEDLERLAASIGGMNTSIFAAYVDLHNDEDTAIEISMLEDEMRKGIGFHSSFATAEDFIKEVVAKITGN
ncbi:MAG: hypothetical protein IIC52_04330 [Proteobacteria bacterium]|nr:hypothetical protein [Pseudomonadota bacterium]